MNIELQSAISATEVNQLPANENAKIEQEAKADKRSKDDLTSLSVSSEASKITNENGSDSEKDANVDSKELSKEEIRKVAQQLQDFVKSLNRNVSFSVDEDSGRDVISVVEVKSGELIRQIPSEEILKLASRISKAAGLIVQEEV